MHFLFVDEEVQQFIQTTSLRFRGSFRSVARVGRCDFHHHSCFEIVLHTDCNGSTSLETGQHLSFQPNSVVINPPAIKHDQRTQKAGTDSCILIESSCPVPDILNQMIYIPNAQAPWIFSDIHLLFSAPQSAHGLDALALHHRAASLFLQLLHYSDIFKDDLLLPGTNALVSEADRLLRTEYQTLRNVSQIADRLNVSADYLRHCYRQQYGTGMKQRLLRLRVEQACLLLTTSTLPLKAIAAACGFHDDRSLSTCFKAIMACTASEYRRDTS